MKNSSRRNTNYHGGVLLTALIAVTIATTLLCAVSSIQRSLTRRALDDTRRIFALHAAEGLAEEGQHAPRNSVNVPRRSIRSLGSLRTDIQRMGLSPEEALPKEFFIERFQQEWRGIECVVVIATWECLGHIRRITISLPRGPSN